MKLFSSPLNRWLQAATSSPFGAADEDAQVYTPREFVAGFIMPPRGAAPLEAAWHAAAVALETERIRVVQHEADGGIYFLAADAADFVSQPNAMTPLASALPGSPGHQGDGAYFVDLGSGIVAVVLKAPESLKCYVGEREEAIRFAGDRAQHWPRDCESWTGFRQFESRQARRQAQLAVFAGMALTAILLGLAIAAASASAMLAHRKDAALGSIRAAQQQNVAQLEAKRPDAYQEYRKLADPVVNLGGKLTRFESSGEQISWEAEFPTWVSDLSALGGGVRSRVENSRVIASKGDK